ncbi:PD-(D/E)XK nuclease-like domain-containing protein, partial [Salmonella enterica]|uniref:PD-(D/E)XK nuclease-like domain-containing protein n=1 Tax=Salmonella enterica TaxID=28901 RepID=UPI003527AD16
AMEFGTSFHTQVLEPERFAAEYVVKPKFDLRTNVGKEGSAAWDAANPGKTIISEADRVAIEGMFDALTERTDIARTIQNSYREKSYFWTDEDTGIACRMRADLLVRDEWTGEIIAIADLKSTQDASK